VTPHVRADDAQRRGHRHGEQQTDEAGERAAGEQRQHHRRWMQRHGAMHHLRRDEVIVDLLHTCHHGDDEQGLDHAAGRQGDDHARDAADPRADERNDVEQAGAGR
jgi:hypothetical protein